MKLLYKIAILAGLIVSVSSCQKEELPSKGGCIPQDQKQESSNQRVSDPSGTDELTPPTIQNQRDSIINDIVGGGDDDRDGGGKKDPKKGG